jgi:8-oxo-dGTP diphosphatase
VANAAAFGSALAAEIVRDSRQSRQEATSAEAAATVRNNASGNSHVGLQAGQVYGNVVIGAEPKQGGRP